MLWLSYMYYVLMSVFVFVNVLSNEEHWVFRQLPVCQSIPNTIVHRISVLSVHIVRSTLYGCEVPDLVFCNKDCQAVNVLFLYCLPLPNKPNLQQSESRTPTVFVMCLMLLTFSFCLNKMNEAGTLTRYMYRNNLGYNIDRVIKNTHRNYG